ncbi:Agamous-like MADS-box protein AGL62 [Striga hermonthica]|uniref:Agamous-like MADS-box protein AGL62 n=1 Tax=Striga hermonthica TaxID=68872 RepID=A0A9N7R3V4_STRHE|nr:Agamous-like MADS-box protein AGL62 [Striga hermonthica]
MDNEEEMKRTMMEEDDDQQQQQQKRTKKTSQGRKKIEIKKIANPSNRQVTFSKRRVGLFKKASELCILSGAEIAIVVHSLGKRVFTFGHPTADAVIDRFLGGDGGESHAPTYAAGDYNRHYAGVCRELDAEKRRGETARGGGGRGGDGVMWWNEAVEGLDLEELERYAAALDELIKNVTMKANDFMVMQSSTSLLPPEVDHMMLVNNNQMGAGVFDNYESFVGLPNGGGGFGQL